ERPLYERFKTEFVSRVAKMKVCDPEKAGTEIGAVVSKDHQNKVLSYIELAKEEGGDVLCGGHAVQLDGKLAEGYYIAPTVIEGLSHTCRTNMEEIFGPVVTIAPFESEEEAIEMANCTKYGLASSVWT